MGQFTTFPIPTTDFYNSLDRSVNCISFGADPTGAADSTAAIQAAIDFAYNNTLRTVYLPAGSYKTTASLYLDAPGNLRTNFANPTIFNFSLSLIGAEGPGNHEGFGTRILPTSNSFTPLFVGTGQGMMVKNINILGPAGVYRGQQPFPICGLGLCGGSGGSSRTRIENCNIENFYYGVQTSANGHDALCDSNTFIKVMVANSAIAFWISGTQNFINSFYDCQGVGTTGILATNGGGVHVFGGNWSVSSSLATSLTISGVSALTQTAFGLGNALSFTATITPDSVFPLVYNAFIFQTTHFGIVPATLASYNAGTHVATFNILQEWVSMYFGRTDVAGTTDFQTELQAATKVFCAEQVTTFQGVDITVDGIQIENSLAPTCLIRSQVTFGNNKPNYLRGVFFNNDPAFPTFTPGNSPTDANLARFYASQVFPFIWIGTVDTYLGDSNIGQGFDPVVIDFSNVASKFVAERVNKFFINIRSFQGTSVDFPNIATESRNYSMGVYDRLYFVSIATQITGFIFSEFYVTDGWGVTQYWGWRPAPWSTPGVTAAMLTTLSGALPAISTTAVSYPMPWGGARYCLADWELASQAKYHFVSNHHDYSYGQNLTTTNVPGLSWSYKGQSFVVSLAQNNLIRCGLGVILNDGTSDIRYLVTGVFPSLQYFTVTGLTSGTKTTIVTGSLIKQEAYSIVTF